MKKHLSEGLMIVFSVLFALMINSFVEGRKTQMKKSEAKQSLIKELESNNSIAEKWLSKHAKMQSVLSQVAYGRKDSLKNELKKYKYLNLGVLFENANLIDEMLQKTAWESVKSTEILNEFDFKTIQNLSKAYELQTIVTDKTVQRIIEHFYDKTSLDVENLDITLIQLSMMMGELVAQEKVMPQLYDKGIELLKKE